MLSPSWLEGCPDEIVKIYDGAEKEILQEMADQISKYNYISSSSMHRKALLEATGATQTAVAKALSKITGKTKEEITQIFTDAGNKTIEDDGKVYKAARVYKENAISKSGLNKIVQTGINQAMNSLQNITRTTVNAAGTQIYQALDNAWMQVSIGGTDRIKAVQDTIKKLADSGLSAFTYSSGHVDTLEVAVRRAVVTGVNQTALRVSDQLADDLGCDLVEVSAHSGARPEHAIWQGHIFSRSGKSDKYPALRASQAAGGTGYGSGEGLGGWNCRHSFGPWVEGQPRRWSQEQLDAMNEKTVSYNGKDLTEYEASQQQRYIERQIRKYKREEALGVEGASEKVKYWQDQQKDFIKQTGFKRQYDRERVFIGSVPRGKMIKAPKVQEHEVAAAQDKMQNYAAERERLRKQVADDVAAGTADAAHTIALGKNILEDPDLPWAAVSGKADELTKKQNEIWAARNSKVYEINGLSPKQFNNYDDYIAAYNEKYAEYEKLEAKISELEDQKAQYYDKLVETIKTARGGKYGKADFHFRKGSNKEIKGYINTALNAYPDTWCDLIDAGYQQYGDLLAKKVSRGYCGYDVIAISGSGTSAVSTSVHELAHACERHVPGIVAQEAAFYEMRTKGESLEKLSKITGNKNYRADELARKDDFESPYMGKDYGGSFFELFSMGTERVLTGKARERFISDTEMMQWVVGVFVGVP